MNQRPFLSAEAVEGFSHEIVADTKAGEGAFDPLDDRRRMAADAIKRIAHTLNLRLQRDGSNVDSEFTPEMEEEDAIRSHLPPDDSALSFKSLLLLGIMLDPRPVDGGFSNGLAVIVSGTCNLFKALAGFCVIPGP